MKKTDILVACGDRPRHLYFAARIAQRFSDCAIITESKSGDAEAQPEKKQWGNIEWIKNPQ